MMSKYHWQLIDFCCIDRELFGNMLLKAQTIELMASNKVGNLFNAMPGVSEQGFGYTVATTEESNEPLTTAGKPISRTRSSARCTPPNGIALTTKMSAAV